MFHFVLRVKLMQNKKSEKQKLLAVIQGYASVLIIGGIFAHDSQSLVAIISSVILGGILLAAGRWIERGKRYALYFTLIFTLTLTLFFVYRFILINKFYPPLVLCFISLFVIFRVVRYLILSKMSHSEFYRVSNDSKAQ
jgi:uncharacterized membrane protein (UPF0136 family)